MPKFLTQGSYSSDGLRGLLKEGGSSRKTTIEKLAQSLGGKVEALCYAFGEDDVFVIGEFPDNVHRCCGLPHGRRIRGGAHQDCAPAYPGRDRRGHKEVGGLPAAGGLVDPRLRGGPGARSHRRERSGGQRYARRGSPDNADRASSGPRRAAGGALPV